MRNKNIFQISAALLGIAFLLTGCSFFKNSHTLTPSDAGINELVPQTEVTLDSKRESAADMCSFLQSSYKKMQELAAAEDAAPDGIKAAKKVEEKYSERLNKLFTLDFSTMSENEIDALLIEMTDLITAIREARDALSLTK